MLATVSERGMYTRLADVPVPRRWWWWGLLVVMVLRDGRRTRKEDERIGQELGESVVTRWKDTDEATAVMLKMTKTMVRLTWAVVALTVVVLGATLHLGLQ